RDRAARDAGPVDDDHRRARIRIHVVQPGQLHRQPGLLQRLADRGIGHALPEIHEPAGKRPQTVAGVDRATGQKDAAVLLGDGAGDDLRVQVEDEVAEPADRLLAVIRRHGRSLERAPAQGAEPDRRRSEEALAIVGHCIECNPAVAQLTVLRPGCYNPGVPDPNPTLTEPRRLFMPRRLLVATLLTLVALGAGWLVAGHAQSGEYKIGVLEPLTGPLAGEGKRHLEGFEIVRDLINERGGVMGKKLTFVVSAVPYPTAAAPQTTPLTIRENVKIVTGTFSSRLCGSASEAAALHNVIYWEP